ncbi:hypothetical protein RQP46_004994 [Phenoliferia psychrophenolica]
MNRPSTPVAILFDTVRTTRTKLRALATDATFARQQASRPGNVPFSVVAGALRSFASTLGPSLLSFRGYSTVDQLPAETQLAEHAALQQLGGTLTTYNCDQVTIERIFMADLFSLCLDVPCSITIVAAVPNPSAFTFAKISLAQRGRHLVLVSSAPSSSSSIDAGALDWSALIGGGMIPRIWSMQPFSPAPAPAHIPAIHVQNPTPRKAEEIETPPRLSHGLLRIPGPDDVDDPAEEEQQWSANDEPDFVDAEPSPLTSFFLSSTSGDDGGDFAPTHIRSSSLASITESSDEETEEVFDSPTPRLAAASSTSRLDSSDATLRPVALRDRAMSLRELEGFAELDFEAEPQTSPSHRRTSTNRPSSVGEHDEILQRAENGDEAKEESDPGEFDREHTPESQIKVPRPLQTSYADSLAGPVPGTPAKPLAGTFTLAGVFRPAPFRPKPSANSSANLSKFQPLVSAIVASRRASGAPVERGVVGSRLVEKYGKGFYKSVGCENFGEYSRSAEEAGCVEMGMTGQSAGWIRLKRP